MTFKSEPATELLPPHLMLLDIRPDHLNMVRNILRRHVPQYAVWAFGSRVKWTAKDYSDLDLCIRSDKPLDFRILGALAEDFSDSDLPYKVDIVDWATTSVSFRKIIEKNKVVIQEKQYSPDVASDMSSNWRKCLLGDVLNLKRGFDLPARDRLPGFIPLISSAGPSDFHNEAKVKAPGVVTGRYGTIGNVYFSKDDFWPLNTTLFVDDFKGNNPRFIYFFLKTIDYLKYSDKGAVPGVNRNHLHTAEVVLPNLPIQNKIAEFLGDIEDRIGLLRETNATLEAIAQALFKSWFVDFDPVRAKQEGCEPEGMDAATAALFPDSFKESEMGLIPCGWLASNMGDISTVGIGKTPPRKESYWFSESAKDTRWVSIRDMGAFGVFLAKTNEFITKESIQRFNVRIIPDNTTLLSFKMTIGRVSITDGEMTTNEAIAHFKLDQQSVLTSEYIYLYLKQFNYANLSSTSSIADAVNSKTVRNIPILVPDKSLSLVFNTQIKLFFRRIKVIEQQIQTLATLRDTLLPRLISGQLRLSDVGDVMKEAG